MARRTFHGYELDSAQRVTMYEALRMHTLGGAYALGEEQTRGSLTAGKFADVIVLDRNPLTTGVDDLGDIAVDEVYLGGEHVYSRSRT